MLRLSTLKWTSFSLALGALASLGCGSSGTSGDTSANGQEELANAPTCTPGSIQLSGVVDSADLAQSTTLGTYGFSNVGNPSALDASFGLGGELHLKWQGTVVNGDSIAATGSLVLPPTGSAPPVSYCIGAGSLIEPLAGGGKFVLQALTQGQTCAASAPAASGSLLGCYGFKTM